MRNNRIEVPDILYGTAWKEAETERLTVLALREGFRGIDTANQRRHYDEAAVGRSIRDAIAAGQAVRDELFLQTKFTFRAGQDHRLPYDPAAPIADQVEQSFASSLEHLGVDQVDSYLLHGPSSRYGLTSDDWVAWRAIEAIHKGGRARMIGVSNFTLEQLQVLCREARVRPSFVQNRCFASDAWDREVRLYCAVNGIVYQGFSLLTANPHALASAQLAAIATAHHRTAAQIVFRFAFEIGITPLTGTTSAEHMQQDLDVDSFGLRPEEIDQIEYLAAR
jgi:diketogulonate reductase-like aldo/keto reductase